MGHMCRCLTGCCECQCEDRSPQEAFYNILNTTFQLQMELDLFDRIANDVKDQMYQLLYPCGVTEEAEEYVPFVLECMDEEENVKMKEGLSEDPGFNNTDKFEAGTDGDELQATAPHLDEEEEE